MPYSEILALLGGALTTLGYIPQLVRILKLKSAREISLLFTAYYLRIYIEFSYVFEKGKKLLMN